MKKKQAAIILVLLMISIGWYYFGMQRQFTKEQMMIKAFNTSKAKVLKTDISGKGVIRDSLRQKEQPDLLRLEQAAEKALLAYGENGVCIEREHNVSDGLLEYRISVQMSINEFLKVTAWREQTKEEAQTDCYIQMDLVQDGKYKDLDNSIEKIRKALATCATNIKTSSSVMGTYNGQLTNRQVDDITRKIFVESRAKEVNRMRERQAITVFAYNPLFDFKKIDNKKVNMELSVCYNEQEDKTYIMLHSLLD